MSRKSGWARQRAVASPYACRARLDDSRTSVSARLRVGVGSGTVRELRMVLPPAQARGDADEHELWQQAVVRELGDGHEDADVGPEGRGCARPEGGAEQCRQRDQQEREGRE